MKILLTLFIIFISSLVFADDISDFQIEGMSVGDSLLDYFSKNEIEKKRQFYTLGGEYMKDYSRFYKEDNNKTYDRVVLFFKSDDTKYIIKGISGRNYYVDDINKCYKIQKIISNDIKIVVDTAEMIVDKKKKHFRFPNSYVKSIYFLLKDSDITVSCYDYSIKDTTSRDRLSVIMRTEELNIYLRSTMK